MQQPSSHADSAGRSRLRPVRVLLTFLLGMTALSFGMVFLGRGVSPQTTKAKPQTTKAKRMTDPEFRAYRERLAAQNMAVEAKNAAKAGEAEEKARVDRLSAQLTEPNKLALVAARGYESESGGYHYVEGQVKNVSDESLKNVVVVATWYDKDGNFIKTDDALIDYNPILPGQTSPFKTITSGNPAMSRYTVEFKHLLGGTISLDDQRQTKRKK
jgi:hypothetical protein